MEPVSKADELPGVPEWAIAAACEALDVQLRMSSPMPPRLMPVARAIVAAYERGVADDQHAMLIEIARLQREG
jgi:hypothetical protein